MNVDQIIDKLLAVRGNKPGKQVDLGEDEIKLGFGDYELISPLKRENSKFTEFGINYYSQIIKPNETRLFNIIFEVPIEFYYDNFTLKYLYNMSYDKDELKFNYKKVKLSPKTFDKDKETVDDYANILISLLK